MSNFSPTSESDLEYFTRHAADSLPFCMQISSPNPGGHVVIVGATHGNEPSGVRAMVDLHRAFESGEIRIKEGKISLLLGNPRAFEKGVRYVDYDLNRAFDRPDASTAEGRRALEIKTFFEDNHDIKAVLDLHSVSIGDFKILVYPEQPPALKELAITLSPIPLHFVYHTGHMPGTLIEAAGCHDIAGLMVECGNHCAQHGVQTALQHIYSLLVHHRLIDDGYRPQTATPATITRYESIQAIKPRINFRFVIDDIQTGSRLKKGQRFAADEGGDHVAPQDCYVVAPSRVVNPKDVDAGFLATLTVLEDPQFDSTSENKVLRARFKNDGFALNSDLVE